MWPRTAEEPLRGGCGPGNQRNWKLRSRIGRDAAAHRFERIARWILVDENSLLARCCSCLKVGNALLTMVRAAATASRWLALAP